MKTWAHFSTVWFIAMILSGCELIHSVEGMSGVWTTTKGKVYAVAQFPKDALPSSHKEIEMTVYPVLGSAKGQKLRISYNSKEKLVLNFSDIDSNPIQLTMNSFEKEEICGEGTLLYKQIRLCYGKEKLDLDVRDPGGEVELGLHLKRGLTFSEPLNSAVTLDEAMGRARFSNYSVLQDAQKLFRSRQEISVARAALIPRLTGMSILSIAMTAMPGGGLGPFSLFQMADSFLPFVYPLNWYRLREKKDAYQAQLASFAALQANQMLATQLLFYSLQRDLTFIERAQVRLDDLYLAQRDVSIQSDIGLLNAKEVEEFEKKVIRYELDLALLKSHYLQELSVFATSLAFHALADHPLSLIPVSLAAAGTDQNVTPAVSEIFREAQSSSLELRTLKYLKDATHERVKGERFCFLPPGAIIYLDASYLAKNRIALSLEKEIEIKTDETVATIEQKAVEFTTKMRAARWSLIEYKRSFEIDERQLARLSLPSEFKVGQIRELEDARDQVYLSETKVIGNLYFLLGIQAVLDRLTLSGVYENLRLQD